MGAPERFQIHFCKYIGFGIGFDTFPYAYFISINLPLISIAIGLGKPYTEV